MSPLLMTERQLNRRLDRAIGNAKARAKLNKIKLTKRELRYIALDDMFDDLPDGAYFAAMESEDYEAEDMIERNESVNKKGYYDTRETVR